MLIIVYLTSTSYIYILILFFFFFQAEDGIRDVAVTGVQTCALPILPLSLPPHRASRARNRGCRHVYWSDGATHGPQRVQAHPVLRGASDQDVCRSEERRVGKECRSRWSPYH